MRYVSLMKYPLVSVDTLASHLGHPNLVIVDASFYLPTEKSDAIAVFVNRRIPGAQFFDLERIADLETPLPHMLPAAEEFAESVAALGISNNSQVVVYDQRGLFSAARAWWMFRVFGHDDVTVLDGGLPKWMAEGQEIERTSPVTPAEGAFIPRFQPELVRDQAAIMANLESGCELLLDARGFGRFAGTTPEPRAGVQSGHIPGAVSLPFTSLLNVDQTMKPTPELQEIFGAVGVTHACRPVTMCGSGITAAVLTLGLAVAGLPTGALYDGSWAEWGSRDDTPIERTE